MRYVMFAREIIDAFNDFYSHNIKCKNNVIG